MSTAQTGRIDAALATVPDGAVQIDDSFGGFGGAHGGYVAAIALRALTASIDDAQRPPRSLTVQLLAPVRTGDLRIDTRLSRAGRSMSSGSVHMEQDGRVVVVALGAFGTSSPSLRRRDLVMPDVPAPLDCDVVVLDPPQAGSFTQRVEHRSAAPPLPLSGSADARLVVWMRLTDERPLDAVSATILADAAPPALFATLDDFAAIPSAEIALHFASGLAHATSPWVLGVFASRDAGEGYAVEDGELWTPGGELVLLSRQLRRVL